MFRELCTVATREKDKVLSLQFRMDVAGAFDTVSHQLLLHNLRKRTIPTWRIIWGESFLIERKISSLFLLQQSNERVFDAERHSAGTPHLSHTLPVLQGRSIDTCERPGSKPSGMGSVDDTSILAYSTSTEESWRILEDTRKVQPAGQQTRSCVCSAKMTS